MMTHSVGAEQERWIRAPRSASSVGCHRVAACGGALVMRRRTRYHTAAAAKGARTVTAEHIEHAVAELQL